MNMMPNETAPHLWYRLFWWTVFAAAFGYVEAAVVIYLRQLCGMAPGQDYRAIFALRSVSFDSVGIAEELRRYIVLRIELCREIATLLLLLGASFAAGRCGRERWGLFGYAFAIWDVTYYLYLALWIGFPRCLTDTDIYFLLPFAWYGPVWLPVLVCMPALLLLSLRLLCQAQPNAPLSRTQTASLASGFWNE